jgi:hypothetical protein
MKLHSDTLTTTDIRAALATARRKGHVTGGIELLTLEEKGSRSRANGFEVRLGSDYADGIHKRRTNDGTQNYAATWHEWGWFIVELFELDANLTFGHYKSENEFHAQTRYAFC